MIHAASRNGVRSVNEGSNRLTSGRVFRTWWPLAASWLLMGIEGPVINVIVARLADPKIHLAAYGSLIFPLALFIEAPIVMLLAASTALCKDWEAYRKIRRFMHVTAGILTAIHALVAFTPLYGIVVRDLWTWAIAYRRFNQGVLIRFGHSLSVGIGTGIRLAANASVLLAAYFLTTLPGTTIATSALIAGVLAEAVYAGLRVRPVLKHRLKAIPAPADPLTTRAFLRFYVPLALTSMIFLGVRPILTAAISRMPNALDSLAAWPVVGGLTFLFRSVNVAYSEVVIAHLEESGSSRALKRFTVGLVTATTFGILLIAATPLSRIWFGNITGLSDDLIRFSQGALWFALLLPGMSAIQSWQQGVILHSKRTRAITEAIIIYLAVISAVLWAGIAWGRWSGITVGLVAMTAAEIARNVWLRVRSGKARRELRERDG